MKLSFSSFAQTVNCYFSEHPDVWHDLDSRVLQLSDAHWEYVASISLSCYEDFSVYAAKYIHHKKFLNVCGIAEMSYGTLQRTLINIVHYLVNFANNFIDFILEPLGYRMSIDEFCKKPISTLGLKRYTLSVLEKNQINTIGELYFCLVSGEFAKLIKFGNSCYIDSCTRLNKMLDIFTILED